MTVIPIVMCIVKFHYHYGTSNVNEKVSGMHQYKIIIMVVMITAFVRVVQIVMQNDNVIGAKC